MKGAAIMKLDVAVALIARVLERMDRGFGMPLFDEWMILKAGPSIERILSYHGRRTDSLQREFMRDIQPLLEELCAGHYEPGHFYFSQEADGARYDAFMCIGPGVYAILNNTTRSMAEVSADPAWRQVQGLFVDLSARFRVDPLREV